MPTSYLAFGSAVAAVGIALILFNIRSHRRHQADADLAESDRRFFDHQYSRRMQTSALTVTFGGLIGLCGYLRVEDYPIFSTVYVIGLLLLTAWLALLAVSDLIASRIYAGKLDRRNRQTQKSLQQTLAEVREAHGLGPLK